MTAREMAAQIAKIGSDADLWEHRLGHDRQDGRRKGAISRNEARSCPVSGTTNTATGLMYKDWP